MRIGVIIPTRKDRPGFVENSLRMLKEQTAFIDTCRMSWEDVMLMDFPPESEEKDITKRYRMGYDKLRNRKLDVIFLWEDDDWYSPTYMQVMIEEWVKAGKPDIFGTAYTLYYHLKLNKYFTMHHPERASAMNTMIIPDLAINWPADSEPFTDMALWISIPGKTFTPKNHIAIGMKHGIGLNGGYSHVDRLHRYRTDGGDFLRKTLDEDSLPFYINISNQLNS